MYQVKAALTKIRAPPVGRVDDTAGVVKLVVVHEAAPKHGFEARSKEMFEKSIRRVAENQNDIYLAEHMSSFGQGVEKLWEQRDEAYRKKVEAHRAALLEKREQEQQKLRRNHVKGIAAAERGIQEWTRNQQVRLAQTHAAAKYMDRTTVVQQTKQAVVRDATVTEVASGIDEFEAIAASHGIVVAATGARVEDGAIAAESREEFFERIAATVGPDAGLKAQAASQLAEIRRMREERLKAVSVRQRRRLAFLQGLEARQDATLASAREDVLVSALVRKPNVQVELEEQLQRIGDREAIFKENRAFRSAEEQRQADIRVAVELERQNTLYRLLVEQHERDVTAALSNYADAAKNRAAVERARNTALCREVVWRSVDTAVVIAQQRELRHSTAGLPPQSVADIGVVFVSGLPMAGAAVVPPCTGVAALSGAGAGAGSDDEKAGSGHGAVASAAPPPEGTVGVSGAVVSCSGVEGEAQDGSVSLATPTPFFERGGANDVLDRADLLDMHHRRGPWAVGGGGGAGGVSGVVTFSPLVSARAEETPLSSAVSAALAPVVRPLAEGADDAAKELDEHVSRRPTVPSLYAPDQLPFVMGEVVRSLETLVSPPPAPPVPPKTVLAIRAAIIGPPGSGKRTQARRLAAACGVEIIDPVALIRYAVRSVVHGMERAWVALRLVI